MSRIPLILASASPRRSDLLRGLGLQPEVRPARVDEREMPGERPEEHVLRLAEEKARAVAGERARRAAGAALVLGADTVVVLDGRILGKPRDGPDAAGMLRFLSGRTHEVHTGVFLLRTDDARSASASMRTRVRFRPLDPRRLDWYVGTGEPLDKAGAYSIQGLGALLSEGIDGSWSNVVGLPLEALEELFRRVGEDLLDRIDPAEAEGALRGTGL